MLPGVVSPKFRLEVRSRYIEGTVTEADFDNTEDPSARAALRLKLDEMLMLQRLLEEQERSKAEFEGFRADTTRKMEEMKRETANLANTLYEFVTRDVLEILLGYRNFDNSDQNMRLTYGPQRANDFWRDKQQINHKAHTIQVQPLLHVVKRRYNTTRWFSNWTQDRSISMAQFVKMLFGMDLTQCEYIAATTCVVAEIADARLRLVALAKDTKALQSPIGQKFIAELTKYGDHAQSYFSS
ncbi:hypothetical protein MMC30_005318 [Trapelia coarctata]|nr:hypothetical protein [Trapelia coarctata]